MAAVTGRTIESRNNYPSQTQASGTRSLAPSELKAIVEAAAISEEWIERVRFSARRRWYERVHHSQDHDVWVISWLPGQSTGFHDHGSSSGAFIVATGVLEEVLADGSTSLVERGETRSFNSHYTHDVQNVSNAPTVSIHAYSPPLTEMNEYDLTEGELVPRDNLREQAEARAEIF